MTDKPTPPLDLDAIQRKLGMAGALYREELLHQDLPALVAEVQRQREVLEEIIHVIDNWHGDDLKYVSIEHYEDLHFYIKECVKEALANTGDK